jgi:glucose-1-phosphate cytidylyltransferase
MTYGDGVTDVNIRELISFHQQKKALVTLTAVKPPGRFGAFKLDSGQDMIAAFKEKPQGDGAWINGGFFVLEPEAINYIDGDSTVWEREPMEGLSKDGMIAAYRHTKFWQAMDTLRDKMHLEKLWLSGSPPWKIWE